jgi:hypothetical protein
MKSKKVQDTLRINLEDTIANCLEKLAAIYNDGKGSDKTVGQIACMAYSRSAKRKRGQS